jgi:acetyltransferase-like isoleucine patch superfamily enzyme
MFSIIAKIREFFRLFIYTKMYGFTIGKDVYISPKAYLDKNIKGYITIGDNCFITRDVIILTHSQAKQGGPRALWGKMETGKVKIGNNVFIGVKAVIMPGVTIGDNVIIGACSLVVKDIPDNVIAVGQPAKVIKEMDLASGK